MCVQGPEPPTGMYLPPTDGTSPLGAVSTLSALPLWELNPSHCWLAPFSSQPLSSAQPQAQSSTSRIPAPPQLLGPCQNQDSPNSPGESRGLGKTGGFCPRSASANSPKARMLPCNGDTSHDLKILSLDGTTAQTPGSTSSSIDASFFHSGHKDYVTSFNLKKQCGSVAQWLIIEP